MQSGVSNHHRLLILAEDAAQGVGNFPHGGVGLDGVEDGGQQVAFGARGLFHGAERCLHARGVAAGAQARQAFHLGALDFRIDAQQGQASERVWSTYRFTPTTTRSPALDGFLIFVGGLLDLALHVADSMARTMPPIASILRRYSWRLGFDLDR